MFKILAEEALVVNHNTETTPMQLARFIEEYRETNSADFNRIVNKVESSVKSTPKIKKAIHKLKHTSALKDRNLMNRRANQLGGEMKKHPMVFKRKEAFENKCFNSKHITYVYSLVSSTSPLPPMDLRSVLDDNQLTNTIINDPFLFGTNGIDTSLDDTHTQPIQEHTSDAHTQPIQEHTRRLGRFDADPLNAYELQRLENIRRNNAMIESLNIGNISDSLTNDTQLTSTTADVYTDTDKDPLCELAQQLQAPFTVQDDISDISIASDDYHADMFND